MNWKQLFMIATPEERLEVVLLMLRAIEARPEVIVVYIDLRRILLRSMFLGILGMLTLTTAFITLTGEPIMAGTTLTVYICIILALVALKPKQSQAHFLRSTR